MRDKKLYSCCLNTSLSLSINEDNKKPDIRTQGPAIHHSSVRSICIGYWDLDIRKPKGYERKLKISPLHEISKQRCHHQCLKGWKLFVISTPLPLYDNFALTKICWWLWLLEDVYLCLQSYFNVNDSVCTVHKYV